MLDRFPRLEVVLPHAGGALPFLIGRLQHGWTVRPECRHLEHGPESYLARFHFDTIAHSGAALGFLIDSVGPERVLPGSDYCFDMGHVQPVAAVEEHARLSGHDRTLILGRNAQRLLHLPA